MKILITGGAGFIGSHLADRLLEKGEEVYVIDDLSTGSLRNVEHLQDNPLFHLVVDTVLHEAVMNELVFKCEQIYHMAAVVGVKQIMNRPVETLETNVKGTEMVLGLANRHKKKVLIASTLLHEPEVVFLDEPTSRLDPSASALVKELILALTEETETTFFICTHMTSLAQDICDVIGVLNEGELVTVGSPDLVVEAASAYTLEEAYLKIVGSKVDREALLAWR